VTPETIVMAASPCALKEKNRFKYRQLVAVLGKAVQAVDCQGEGGRLMTDRRRFCA